jgi:Flp pilus assembly protein TadG
MCDSFSDLSFVQAKQRGRAKQRGIAVLLTALMLLLLLPMLGLLFDGTMMFVIKARLQGAVDGAALQGARALARGADSASQIAAAQAAAVSYVNLNYPSGYFFSSNVAVGTPTVDLTVQYQRTVSVLANVTYPGLFTGFLHLGISAVYASASSTRKDVNVVMVVDRSGSLALSGSCAPLMAAATNFVNQFASGRDNVGLVTFASSTYVNFPVANTFDTASPDVSTMINGINCAGSTSSAMALWVGYDQLVKLNESGALNVILFFTDGQPTGVVFAMPVANASPCTAYSHGSTVAGAKGTITGLYNTFTNVNEFFGILNQNGAAGSNGLQDIENDDLLPAPNSAGCTYYSGWALNDTANNMANTSDFVGVPTTDVYGDSAATSYQPVTLNAAGTIDLANPANAQAMALNAADSAATLIRAGANDPSYGRGLSNILIYSIGLGNAAIPASPDFLERASNDVRSSIYNSAEPQGEYVYAATTADLQQAFATVASQILRLAK